EFSLPKSLKEVSGMTLSSDKKIIWTLEDQGNKNKIYGISAISGKLVKEVEITDAVNTDWEELTTDKKGFSYIGDFGNNENDRKDLVIYKIDLRNPQEQIDVLQTTTFYYPEQKSFPPKKSELMFDCEAFVVYQNDFYLFTKNRSKDFDGTLFVYKVPNQLGNFAAQKVGTITLDGGYNDAVVTAATINSKEDKIVLLSHKNVHILSGFNSDNFNKVQIKTVELNHNSQKESIVFKDDSTLLIADERNKKTGGNIYSLSL
ncbi:MAG: hypothetical protein Q4G16_02030, partial [Cruoricaptor ignavus]|nr:hypothetical protein [Cruoricaptor ignavus]